MNKVLDLKYTIPGLAIALIISFVLSWFSSIPFWVLFPIVIVALVLNAFLLEYEDNLPGGFNDPTADDEIKSEYEKRKKRLLPIRIGIWVFASTIICFVLLYYVKGV